MYGEEQVLKLTVRIGNLEAINKTLRQEIQQMSKKNYEMKNQQAKEKLATEQEMFKQLDEIKKERDKLKRTNAEILKFLSDYGLKWVGGDSGPEAPFKSPRESGDQTEELKEIGPCQRPQLPKEIDTVVLSRRIEELNFVAEKQYITTIQGNMKGFKSHSDVEIIFHLNGLIISGFPFYDYQTR